MPTHPCIPWRSLRAVCVKTTSRILVFSAEKLRNHLKYALSLVPSPLLFQPFPFQLKENIRCKRRWWFKVITMKVLTHRSTWTFHCGHPSLKETLTMFVANLDPAHQSLREGVCVKNLFTESVREWGGGVLWIDQSSIFQRRGFGPFGVFFSFFFSPIIRVVTGHYSWEYW